MRIKRLFSFAIALGLSFLPIFFTSAQLKNPVAADSIEQLLVKIIDAAIVILMPFVVLAIIYSGFMFLIARGNKEALSKAKTNFVWVVIGVAVLLGAKIISAMLQSTVGQIVN